LGSEKNEKKKKKNTYWDDLDGPVGEGAAHGAGERINALLFADQNCTSLTCEYTKGGGQKGKKNNSGRKVK